MLVNLSMEISYHRMFKISEALINAGEYERS